MVICHNRIFYREGAVKDVFQKSREDRTAESGAYPVVDFDQDGRWYDQRLACAKYQTARCLVVGIVSIQRRVERSSIEYQRQGLGTIGSSAVLRAMSV